MSFCVYVIQNSERGKIYIGQTDNIEKRLARHNGLLPTKRVSFTKKMDGKWNLVYSEEYGTRKEAMKREKELKSYRGREFIKNKIENMRP